MEIQTSQVCHDFLDYDGAATSSHMPTQPTRNQPEEGAKDNTDSSTVSVVKPANVVTHGDRVNRLVPGPESPSNVTRLCLRVPRARSRLNNVQYDPPFALKPAGLDLASAFVQQYDVVCTAYDEVGTQHDGIIIRDIGGRDWVVQKGLLWHRELWEEG